MIHIFTPKNSLSSLLVTKPGRKKITNPSLTRGGHTPGGGGPMLSTHLSAPKESEPHLRPSWCQGTTTQKAQEVSTSTYVRLPPEIAAALYHYIFIFLLHLQPKSAGPHRGSRYSVSIVATGEVRYSRLVTPCSITCGIASALTMVNCFPSALDTVYRSSSQRIRCPPALHVSHY